MAEDRNGFGGPSVPIYNVSVASNDCVPPYPKGHPNFHDESNQENIRQWNEGYRLQQEARDSRFASSDLIRQIVDRDTPPDNRNEVVDHYVNGQPITRGDLERINGKPPVTR